MSEHSVRFDVSGADYRDLCAQAEERIRQFLFSSVAKGKSIYALYVIDARSQRVQESSGAGHFLTWEGSVSATIFDPRSRVDIEVPLT